MHRRAALGNLLVLAAIGSAAPAFADTVVLTPVIPERGVSSDAVGDLFSLFSSEMEFMGTVDEIIEIRVRPPALNARCLDSSRCLATLAKEAGGDALLTGRVESSGDNYVLDLVYFAEGSIQRRKSFTVPKAPTPLVNAITPVLAEMLTGVSPEEEKKESQMAGVSFADDDDDFAFGEPEPAPAAPAPAPAPASTTRTRNERIVAPPPPPDPEPEVEDFDDFDPDAFDLSMGDPSEIQFGEVDDDELMAGPTYLDDEDEFDDPAPPPPRTSTRTRDIAPPPPRRLDLDGDEPQRTRTSRDTRSKAQREAPQGFEFRRVYLTAKGGLSRYGIFTFGTVGAEIAVRASGGLTIAAGIQTYIVQREVDTQGTVETNFIFPANLGLLYRFKEGRFQPYMGADFVFTQLLRDAQTGQNSFAFGGRVRAGFDYFFSPQVGLNVDLGLGVLAGEQWPTVDAQLRPIGLYPTGTAGLTFAF